MQPDPDIGFDFATNWVRDSQIPRVVSNRLFGAAAAYAVKHFRAAAFTEIAILARAPAQLLTVRGRRAKVAKSGATFRAFDEARPESGFATPAAGIGEDRNELGLSEWPDHRAPPNFLKWVAARW